ncbi:MAG: AarF/ABC1/UbiB kinase family protein [Pseudomonadota bacterium]
MSGADRSARVLSVPSGRLTRMARMGGLATGIAGRMALGSAGQLARGKRPALSDLLLTPGNARRLTEELSRMRGAAMKLGQLLSMEAGDVLPPELAEILGRLRAEAHTMPPKQLKAVLSASWGTDFLRRFAQFDVRPLASASIGQVHRAQTRDGRDLAIKVQYPGVRQSIDSDLRNLAALIRASGLLPKTLEIRPLLAEANRQLHEEADYRREGDCLTRFRALLADDPDFLLPALHADLTTPDILAMDFVAADPVESVARRPQDERDRLARLLIALTLREIFDFGVMQTDPNFANYRYQPETGRVVLLDFGATRDLAPATQVQLRSILETGIEGDRAALQNAAIAAGIFPAEAPPAALAEMMAIAETALAPLRAPGRFDFATSDLAARVRAAGLEVGADNSHWHIPPADMLFLQRKIGGMYLLCTRLSARVDIHALIQPYLRPAPRTALATAVQTL